MTEISYIVVETRGLQFFGTLTERILAKCVYQDLQHGEQLPDQGNVAYGQVYDLWLGELEIKCPNMKVPMNA